MALKNVVRTHELCGPIIARHLSDIIMGVLLANARSRSMDFMNLDSLYTEGQKKTG